MKKRVPRLAAAATAITLTAVFAFAPAAGTPPSTTASTPSPEPSASPEATLTADDFKVGDLTAADVMPPPSPSPAPEWAPPAGYAGSLKPEDWVQVTGTDSCLNVRVSPGLFWHNPDGDQPVQTLNCLPDGFTGQLSYGPNTSPDAYQATPTQADGYWWWYLLGQGWVAENWLAVTEAPSNARPDLAGAGLIAFMRQDGVYMMNADGSDERLVFPLANGWSAATVRWSPDGESLAIGTQNGENGYRVLTTVVDTQGTVLVEYPGLVEVSWSPDGTKLSALRVSDAGGLGGYQSVPIVHDLTSGTEIVVGQQSTYVSAPVWLPDGSAVAQICRSWSGERSLPDGTIEKLGEDCGGDGLRTMSWSDGSERMIVPMPEGVYYWSPSFSPDGASVAMFSSGGDCRGYSIFDTATGARTSCQAIPEDNFGGRCGGSAETGASDWTPDGRTLAYHRQSGEGLNGVALVDVATGERRMIPTTGSSSISFSPDGAHLSYESAGYVWTADVDGTDVTRVTDGWMPAWQPRP